MKCTMSLIGTIILGVIILLAVAPWIFILFGKYIEWIEEKFKPFK